MGETVPEVLSTARGAYIQTEGTVSSNTDRLRPVSNTFIFFLLRFKSFKKKISFTLQPMCVEVGRVHVMKRAIDCKSKQNIKT